MNIMLNELEKLDYLSLSYNLKTDEEYLCNKS